MTFFFGWVTVIRKYTLYIELKSALGPIGSALFADTRLCTDVNWGGGEWTPQQM